MYLKGETWFVLQSTPSRTSQALLFARNFFKHPRMLGSLIPSSRFLIKHLLEQIDFRRARVIVEYGPGVGNITTALLRRMRRDATLVVIETNGDFVSFLKDELRDPRLHVVHGSAADVRSILAQLKLDKADYILSGIPFTTLPEEVRDQILHETRAALKPDGAMLVYQFTNAVKQHLTPVFRQVEEDFEPLNILPARLFYCTP